MKELFIVPFPRKDNLRAMDTRPNHLAKIREDLARYEREQHVTLQRDPVTDDYSILKRPIGELDALLYEDNPNSNERMIPVCMPALFPETK